MGLMLHKHPRRGRNYPLQGTKASPGGVTQIFLLIIKGYLKAGQKKGALILCDFSCLFTAGLVTSSASKHLLAPSSAVHLHEAT